MPARESRGLNPKRLIQDFTPAIRRTDHRPALGYKKGTPTRAKDGIRKRNAFFFTASIIFTIRGHEKRFFVSLATLVPRGQKTRHFIGLSFEKEKTEREESRSDLAWIKKSPSLR
jgi:hypothetical protein